MILVHAAVARNSKGVMAVKSAPERSSNQSRRMPLAGLAHVQPLLINDRYQPPPDIEIRKLNFRFGSKADDYECQKSTHSRRPCCVDLYPLSIKSGSSFGLVHFFRRRRVPYLTRPPRFLLVTARIFSAVCEIYALTNLPFRFGRTRPESHPVQGCHTLSSRDGDCFVYW